MTSTASSECVSSERIPPAADWVADGGFFLVALAVAVTFWGLTFICEEYCVPAITVFCKRNKISDDIAGAIFIGTGLSLPVLFASFVGLFISNNAIGVGTVVGGDIFNHLVNIAASIHAAPNRTLKLDAVTFTREMVFYILSCLAVVWVAKGNLHNSFASMFQRDEWLSCLSIHWTGAFALVGFYVLYCVVDAYFGLLTATLSRCYVLYVKSSIDRMMYAQANLQSDRGSDHMSDGPDEEQAEDILFGDGSGMRRRGLSQRSGGSFDAGTGEAHFELPPLIHDDFEQSIVATHNDEALASAFALSPQNAAFPPPPPPPPPRHIAELPRPLIDLDQPRNQDDDVDFGDFAMYMRSSFYAAHAIGCIPNSRAWKLRHFTLDTAGLYYRLERHLPKRGPHVRFIDVFDLEDVRVTNHELFEFSIRLRERQKAYYFRGCDQHSFAALVHRLTDLLYDIKKRNESELRAMALKSMVEISGGREDAIVDPDNESVGEAVFVVPAEWTARVVYFVTLPLKAAIYFTTPDVRRPGREHRALLSILASIIWLAGMTYVLVLGLGELANLLRISSAIMGLTAGAWSACYPALWSSVVVARSGFGDMAVCNALGSNVFGNLIGLGLPWWLYSLVYRKTYTALEDDGVALSLSALMVVAGCMYVVVALNKWVLKSWMVPLFAAAYLAFIVYFIYFTIEL